MISQRISFHVSHKKYHAPHTMTTYDTPRDVPHVDDCKITPTQYWDRHSIQDGIIEYLKITPQQYRNDIIRFISEMPRRQAYCVLEWLRLGVVFRTKIGDDEVIFTLRQYLKKRRKIENTIAIILAIIIFFIGCMVKWQ